MVICMVTKKIKKLKIFEILFNRIKYKSKLKPIYKYLLDQRR